MRGSRRTWTSDRPTAPIVLIRRVQWTRRIFFVAPTVTPESSIAFRTNDGAGRGTARDVDARCPGGHWTARGCRWADWISDRRADRLGGRPSSAQDRLLVREGVWRSGRPPRERDE